MPTTYAPDSDVLYGEWRRGRGGLETHTPPTKPGPHTCDCGQLLTHRHTKQCRPCWLIAQRDSLGPCCPECGCLLKSEDEQCPNCQVPPALGVLWIESLYPQLRRELVA